MAFCQQCQSVSTKPIARKSAVVFRHDYESLRRAVEENCLICTRVWDSLSTTQQTVVQSRDFTGLECKISFTPLNEEGELDESIFLSFKFQAGDELWDCDEANEVAGWSPDFYGHFVILDASSMFILAFFTIKTIDGKDCCH